MHSDPHETTSPVPRESTRTFPARLAILPETAAFVEGFCADHGMSRGDTLRLVLIVEELVSNTIAHGYGDECDAPITLVLTGVPEGVALRYEDTAPAFAVAAALPDAARPLDTELDARPVGGLGLRLLAHFSDSVRHAREDGCNRVWLTLRRTG